MKNRLAWSFVVLLGASISHPALAQERGQYIPGFAGLNSGMHAPEGVSYVNLFIWYPSSRIKDENGRTAPLNFDLNLLVDFNAFTYTTKAKFLGASYGMTLGIPIVNTPISLPRLGGLSPTGIADLYVEPLNLGWKLKKADIKAVYSFIAPTGKFGTPDETTTTDYWGHQVTLASTAYLDANKLTQVSVSTNWEFHHKKRHSDVKVGNNMTVEAGVGQVFVKNQGKQLLQFGVIGYAEFQLTKDSGSGVPILAADKKDRVFAMGPEFGVIVPAKKLNFLIRVLPEFGARNRTQGLTLLVAAAKTF